jgi:hypothetical protein
MSYYQGIKGLRLHEQVFITPAGTVTTWQTASRQNRPYYGPCHHDEDPEECLTCVLANEDLGDYVEWVERQHEEHDDHRDVWLVPCRESAQLLAMKL